MGIWHLHEQPLYMYLISTKGIIWNRDFFHKEDSYYELKLSKLLLSSIDKLSQCKDFPSIKPKIIQYIGNVFKVFAML